MATETFDSAGAYTIALAGKCSFVIAQLTSGGGTGNPCPPVANIANPLGGSHGGGGGATLSNAALLDDTIYGYVVGDGDDPDLHVVLGNTFSNSYVGFEPSDRRVSLSPGQGSVNATETGALGGALVIDDLGVANEDTFAEGGDCIIDGGDTQTEGFGGGSAGGIGGAAFAGNNSNSSQTAGSAPTAGVGGGGNGGNTAANGANGVFPGGGGGGGGFGTTGGGTEGGPKAVITYDLVDQPVVTSYAGDAIVPLSVGEGATEAAEMEATGLPSVFYRIIGGDDELLFELASPTSGELTFLVPPDYEVPTDADEDNVYEVIVEAYCMDVLGTEYLSQQEYHITVTNDTGDDESTGRRYIPMILGLTIDG